MVDRPLSKRKFKQDPDEVDDVKPRVKDEQDVKVRVKTSDSDDEKPFVAKQEGDAENEDENTRIEAKPKPTKKAKKATADDSDDQDFVPGREEGDTLMDDDGKPYFLLAPQKRCTLSEFKGKQYVNIREYYTDKADGKDKPGKKGISLSLDQWEMLKSKTDVVDGWISRASRGSSGRASSSRRGRK